MSDDRYPTKREIKQLKTYCGHLRTENAKLDIGSLVELLKEIWYMPDWGIHRSGRRFELHTGGWSGNEEIIGVLEESLFWLMCWERSERGGHYYFELPDYSDTRTLYLAGPIDGVTPEMATGWRRKVRETLTGWTVLDPTEGKDLYAPGVNDTVYTPEEIVEADLDLVMQAEVVLVDWREAMWRHSVTNRPYMLSKQPLRVGTICEAWEAHRLGKRVVAFGALRRGYWIRYCVGEWYDTLEDALNKIQEDDE